MIKPDFTSKESLDDKFLNVMFNMGMSNPVSLNEADLTRPFVYYRKFGVFYVTQGMHQYAMATLLAWEMDCYNYLRIDHKSIGISDFHSSEACVLADYFMDHYKGVCYMSSLNNKFRASNSKNLNELELDIFYPIVFN